MHFSDFGVIGGNMVYTGFNHFTSEAMPTQEATLLKIMKRNKDCELGKKYDFANIHSIKEFQDKVPLSTFEDYAPLIDRMVENNESNIITCQKIRRYCASSGSVGKPKLQPKVGQDIWNMHCMGLSSTAACAQNYFRANGIMKKLPKQMGPLLMSLNGHKLKNGVQCNGAGQVPFTYMTPFLKYFISTPLDILYPEDEENTNIPYFQLRFCLNRKDITYVGSMVITLLTTMFEYLENNWEMICNDIEHGTIDASVKCPDSLRQKYGHMKPDPKRAEELRAIFRKGFDEPVAQKIWPQLCWGYGMIGSTLAVYVDKLKRYTGDLPMHNMGYAASEGFMAMPTSLNETDYVVLPRSLIYEFIPVDGDENARPLLMDQLEVGKDYEIIITNFSGLYRYRILDIVRCTGYYNQAPRIEFLYRSNMGLNLANEKTTTQMLDWTVQKIEEQFGFSFEGFSYYADSDPEIPRYILLAEENSGILAEKHDEIEKALDEYMRQANEKYEKYRKWGMLSDPVVLQLEKGSYDAYKSSLVAQGRVLNQIKPVTVINTPEKKEFFFGKVMK